MNRDGTPEDALDAAMFRAFVRGADSFVSCIDRQRRLLFLNRTVSRELASVIGQPIENFVAPPDREAVIGAVETAFASGQPQSLRFDGVLADGRRLWLETRFFPFIGPGDAPMALQITIDRTEERRLSEQLGRSERFQRQIVENLPDYVVLLDRERRFCWVNRLASGLDETQVLGFCIDDFISAEHRPEVRDAIRRAFDTGAVTTYEAEAYGDGQEKFHYVSRVVPVASPASIQNVLVITTDVTAQRRAELAVRASEARFRALAEHSPDFIAILGSSRVFEYINRAPTGFTGEEIVGRAIEDLADRQHAAAACAAADSVLRTGTATQFECQFQRDAAIHRVRLAPFESTPGGKLLLLVGTDITNERAAESARESFRGQLQQAQRLESLGRLAGGIAHDFNNLLQVIKTNLHFAEENLLRGGSATEELTQSSRAAERAADLTAHLLAIGRRQHVDPRCIDLAELVDRCVRMLRRTIPENIRIISSPPNEPCHVSVDPPQLEQVLLNLCLNARDAMPDGGSLEISVAIDETRQGALLRVADTGHGIAKEHLARIFEPFFTTRAAPVGAGAGSGLGLAVAAGIVAAHGGTLFVESEQGRGAVFSVRLPRVTVPRTTEAPAIVRGHPTGRETVLVAEDESRVRSQVVRVLASAGYSVIEADNGATAVARFQERSHEIDLVFLDVVMPKLDGWQAFLRMNELRPGVKALFTSGYAANALPDDFGKMGKRLLPKPYQPSSLLEMVRQTLDGLSILPSADPTPVRER